MHLSFSKNARRFVCLPPTAANRGPVARRKPSDPGRGNVAWAPVGGGRFHTAYFVPAVGLADIMDLHKES